jgi:hypothetical protein
MTGFKCSGEPLAAGLDLRRRVRSHLRVRWAAAGTPPAPSRARRTSPVAGPGRTSRQSRHPTSSAASCPWASTVVVAFIPTPWSPSLLFTAPDNDRPAGAKEPSGLPPDHAGQAHQPGRGLLMTRELRLRRHVWTAADVGEFLLAGARQAVGLTGRVRGDPRRAVDGDRVFWRGAPRGTSPVEPWPRTWSGSPQGHRGPPRIRFGGSNASDPRRIRRSEW